MSGGEPQLSRRSFVRRAAGVGVGFALGGVDLVGLSEPAAGALPPVRRFHSRPDLIPPTVSVVHREGTPAPGSLFLAPSSGPGQRGTLITDDAGEPIWFRPSTPVTAMNFRAATLRGASLLTWWEGKTENGLGEGTHVVADDHYRILARIPTAGGLTADLHELILTQEGTLLVTAWEIVEQSLASIGGPASWPVVGGVVQELAYPSGKLLFEWHSLDHVALVESYAGVGNPFDYFHINSIAPSEDGQLLISARNTWAVYKIDRGSGEIIWRLGGKRGDFALGAGTRFAWQHDARLHPGGLLSLFDDGATPQVQAQSRGLLLSIDETSMRASLHRAYTHTPPLLARYLGSVQLLEGGNVLVGFGTAPYLTEYAADGRVLLDARLPPKGENYRALRFPWTGRPLAPPTLVASSITGPKLLYASWNGATAVASWLLRTGPDPSRLRDATRTPRTGFETTFDPPAGERYAAAVALDAVGNALAASPTTRI